ncbi:hypothetical protein [Nocardia sp. NPDC050435]|uniref:hypothetical protein n=1 Tax=Nocardia sp. NPDC050435 TaxID=3155040 RepID=UPI0033E090D9
MTDPLYWLSYGIEAMISIPIITIMVVATTAARWGRELPRGKVVFFETALLGTTIGLNAGPHLSAGHWGKAAEFSIAPVMVGVVIWLHAWVSARYAQLIDSVSTAEENSPDHREPPVEVTITDEHVAEPWAGRNGYSAMIPMRKLEGFVPPDFPVPDLISELPRNGKSYPDNEHGGPNGHGYYGNGAGGNGHDAKERNGHNVNGDRGNGRIPNRQFGNGLFGGEVRENNGGSQGANGRNGSSADRHEPENVYAGGRRAESSSANGSVWSHDTSGGEIANGRTGYGHTSDTLPINGRVINGSTSALADSPAINSRGADDTTNSSATGQVDYGHRTGPALTDMPNGSSATNGQLADSAAPAADRLGTHTSAAADHNTTDNSAARRSGTDNPTTDARFADGHATENPATNRQFANGDTTESRATDSQATNGQVADNHAAENPAANRRSANGDTTESHATNSPATDGRATDSPATAGRATNSPATDGRATNSPATDGRATNSPATDGRVADGHATESAATSGRFATGDTVESRLTNGQAATHSSATNGHTTAQSSNTNGHATANREARGGGAADEAHEGVDTAAAARRKEDAAAEGIEAKSRKAKGRSGIEHDADDYALISEIEATTADSAGAPPARPARPQPEARTEPVVEQLTLEADPGPEPRHPRITLDAIAAAREAVENPVDEMALIEADEEDGVWAVARAIIERRVSKLPVDQVAEILTLADQSWTPMGIGSEVGISSAAVNRILEAARKLRYPYALAT